MRLDHLSLVHVLVLVCNAHDLGIQAQVGSYLSFCWLEEVPGVCSGLVLLFIEIIGHVVPLLKTLY